MDKLRRHEQDQLRLTGTGGVGTKELTAERQIAEERYPRRLAAQVRLQQAADRQRLAFAHLDRRVDGARVQTGHPGATDTGTDADIARAHLGVELQPDAVA